LRSRRLSAGRGTGRPSIGVATSFDQFPSTLPLPRAGVLFLYVAGIGRMGNPVYRFMGRFETNLEVVR